MFSLSQKKRVDNSYDDDNIGDDDDDYYINYHVNVYQS